MIAILGDIHFSSSRDYLIAVSNEILNWFRSWKYNTPGNELILAGDVVHSAVNGGLVIDMVEQLVSDSKFDAIHIIPGNHDLKRKDGVVQLAYEFLRERPNIYIYDKAAEAEIQGLRVLFLPHYIPASATEPSMTESYSNIYKNQVKDYDIVVGHFMEESVSFGALDAIKNISKIRTKHLCLGHLHIRSNPNIYIGSVYANKSTEEDSTRAAWIIDEKGNKYEDKLPVFCEYITVRYPEELPPSNAKVRALTIANCTNERLARMKYGESVFIRKLVHSLDVNAKKDFDYYLSDESYELRPDELFKEFIRTRGSVIDRNVATLCITLLKKSTNLVYGDGNSSSALL